MKSLVTEHDHIALKIGPKKCHIITFGCQMNEYDSQTMAQLLKDEYQPTAFMEEADLIIINTCSIRQKAEHKLYSLLGRLKRLKKKRPNLKIGVAGCVAQQIGEKLFEKMPHVDFVIGPQGLYKLPQLIKLLEGGLKHLSETNLASDFKIPFVNAPLPKKGQIRGFVTIMQGCDNFCTYCIVPYVRGRETSRPSTDILKEIESLVKQGVKDITLLGQNVNSYGKKGPHKDISFPELLTLIDKNFGEEIRLRFTTSHPKDLSEELIDCFGSLRSLCEHLHLPVQSGSNKILKAMNRHYKIEDYLSKVNKLKKICPDITITTDLIVGFPGESHEDFLKTLELLKAVRFDQAFAFKYSERPGTAAEDFKDKVSEEVKSERLTKLLELQNQIGLEQYKKMEAKTVEVLIESHQDKKLVGRTRGNHIVNLIGDEELVGRLLNVYIERACHHSLNGIIVH